MPLTRNETNWDDDSGVIVRILQWPEPPDWNDVYYLSPRAARQRVWREMAGAVKAPLLQRIADVPGARVTNPLEGSLQAIVAATPAAWEVLLDRRHPVIDRNVISMTDDRFVVSEI